MLKWDQPKDPGDILDYAVNVAGVIDPNGVTGDTISSVVWTVPLGLTKVTQTHSGAIAKVWLDGGTPLRTYVIHMRAVSVQGRVVDRDVHLDVDDQ